MSPLSTIPGQNPSQFPHLTASSSLSTLSNFYGNNNNASKENNNNNGHETPRRSPSPTLNPGSPEGRSESNSHSDNEEDAIQV